MKEVLVLCTDEAKCRPQQNPRSERDIDPDSPVKRRLSLILLKPWPNGGWKRWCKIATGYKASNEQSVFVRTISLTPNGVYRTHAPINEGFEMRVGDVVDHPGTGIQRVAVHIHMRPRKRRVCDRTGMVRPLDIESKTHPRKESDLYHPTKCGSAAIVSLPCLCVSSSAINRELETLWILGRGCYRDKNAERKGC